MPGSVATEFGESGGARRRLENCAGRHGRSGGDDATMPARTMVSRVEMRPSKPQK